jgi:FecR protein
MPRPFSLSVAVRAVASFALVSGLVLAALPRPTVAADTSLQLQRVRGTIGYQTAENSTDFKPVFGKVDLPADDFAVTRAQSAAVVALPDSSLVSLGENTNVQMGAFDGASASPGSTITLKGGSLRFDIRRPAGGAANYHFTTATSQIAVRGTVGLLAFVNGVTTVGCVACAADSVTVTTATQTLTLVTGQFVTVSALGAITTGALSTVVGAFSGAGVPVTAQVGAAAAGIPAAATGAIIPAVAGAAVAGAAIGIAASQPTSQPASTNTPNGVGGAPNATPTGSVNLTSHFRPLPTPTPTATPHAPVAAPVPAPPGRTGR